MKKKIILNHKSNLNYDEICDYKNKIEQLNKMDIILFPNIIYLSMFKDSKIKVGTQNFYSYNMGEYTGEINLESLKYMGINYCMVNHDERKKYGNETTEMIKEKIFKSLNSNVSTILVIGEDKEMKNPFKYIKKYMDYYLKNIDDKKISNLSILYEPTWIKNLDNCQEVDIIRKVVIDIKEYFIDKYKSEIEVYYAAGVDEDNIKSILEVCDGVGIGKKSIDIKFIKRLVEQLWN